MAWLVSVRAVSTSRMDNKASDPAPKFCGIERAARITGLAPMTLRKWSRHGRIPARRAGRLILFDLAELDAWLAGLPSATDRDAMPKRKARA